MDLTSITSQDKNGETLYIGDNVITPEPNNTDLHGHEFNGQIVDIYANGNCVVEDGDGDCFEIEGSRLISNND